MNQIRLALGIISGRIDPNNLDNEGMYALGFDPGRFGYYGTPTKEELKERAEDIICYELDSLRQECKRLKYER